MRLRSLLLVLCCLLLIGWWLWPKPEPKPSLQRIGVLQFTDNNLTTLAGFKQGLAEAGLREDHDILYLSSEPVQNRQQLEEAARALVRQRPDLIFVSTTPATLALKQVTSELAPQLPVVFAPVNDPVSAGIVSNLRQPEANLTGVRLALSEGRRLQSLKNVFPDISRVCVPFTPGDKAAEASLEDLREAARILDLELLTVPFVHRSNQAVINELIPPAAEAILLPREGRVMSQTADFVAIAKVRRLPLSAARFSQIEVGALLGYGFVGEEIGKQAARLARQLLKGQPVATLPVETARDYLFINLDTAAEMGLEIPSSTLRRADLLIQDQQKISHL